MTIALKTASYGTVHIAVATMIAYLLTGDIAAAIGIGLIEPVVQTGVFAVHEMIWRRIERWRLPKTIGPLRSRIRATAA